MKCPPPPPNSPVSPLAGKESFGFAPSPVLPVPCSPVWNGENCLPGWYGSADSKSLGTLADICTGSLSVRSPRRNLSKELKDCLEIQYMPNFQGPKPPMTTSVRKTLESLDRGNGERNPFDETPKSIGSPSGSRPPREIWPVSRRPYVWSVTGHLGNLYFNFRAIAADHLSPTPIVREVFCFWGKSGTGKSRRAWHEAGLDCYSKCPRSKFWDGYQGQQHVVIDEFRGGIDVSHMLRWLDRYPCRVEIKGSSRPLSCTKIWITSNLNPLDWYPDLDVDTKEALIRRINITKFD